jgi:hypothetical protein
VPGLSGSFRVSPFIEAESDALHSKGGRAYQPSPPPQSLDTPPGMAQHLVSKLPVTKHSARPARNLPLRFAFPHFGPSIFLVSELTSENQVPTIELDFSRDRKRGE